MVCSSFKSVADEGVIFAFGRAGFVIEYGFTRTTPCLDALI